MKAICVNVTTKQSYSDPTLILQPGEHPFINRESVVYYAGAAWLDMAALNVAIAVGLGNLPCHQRESCAPEMLKKIRCGLLRSPFTKRDIKRHCGPLWAADCGTPG